MSKELHEPEWYRRVKGIATGTAAGIAVTLVGHPFDTLKVRLQTQPRNPPLYKGLVDCVVKTLKWEGVGGLYKGVGSPIAGQVFFRTILFSGFYEANLFIGTNYRSGGQLVPLDYFASGAFAGFLASFAEGPIELFKSKMQVQIISEKMNMPLSVKYSSILHCLTHTLTNFGIRGVFQGLGPTLIRDTVGFSLYFGSNEFFKVLLAGPGQKPNEIGLLKFILAAGISGLIFWNVVYNVDVIKSAMMSDDADRKFRKYLSMADCARKLYTNEGGYARFWKGYAPCIIRAFPANAIMLYVVDITRKAFPQYDKLFSGR